MASPNYVTRSRRRAAPSRRRLTSSRRGFGASGRENSPELIAGDVIIRVQCGRPVALDNAARHEIDEMCVDRASGGAMQPRLQAAVQSFDDLLDRRVASLAAGMPAEPIGRGAGGRL